MKNSERLKVDKTRPRAVENQARLKTDRRQGPGGQKASAGTTPPNRGNLLSAARGGPSGAPPGAPTTKMSTLIPKKAGPPDPGTDECLMVFARQALASGPELRP